MGGGILRLLAEETFGEGGVKLFQWPTQIFLCSSNTVKYHLYTKFLLCHPPKMSNLCPKWRNPGDKVLYPPIVFFCFFLNGVIGGLDIGRQNKTLCGCVIFGVLCLGTSALLLPDSRVHSGAHFVWACFCRLTPNCSLTSCAGLLFRSVQPGRPQPQLAAQPRPQPRCVSCVTSFTASAYECAKSSGVVQSRCRHE